MTPIIFKRKLTEKGKAPAPNSIKHEFLKSKDKRGVAYTLNMIYAVDEKAWHSQRVMNSVWIPKVWGWRPGRGDFHQGLLPARIAPRVG